MNYRGMINDDFSHCQMLVDVLLNACRLKAAL